MKIMPIWWDSIRSLVTLFLTLGFVGICTSPILFKVSIGQDILATYVAVYVLTLNYYFKEKTRNPEEGNGDINETK